MKKRQMVKDIIRNIYERDWYTRYSQRPRKWKCGWINRKERAGDAERADTKCADTSTPDQWYREKFVDVLVDVLNPRDGDRGNRANRVYSHGDMQGDDDMQKS